MNVLKQEAKATINFNFFYKLEQVFILSECLLCLNVKKWILLSVPPTGHPTEYFV